MTRSTNRQERGLLISHFLPLILIAFLPAGLAQTPCVEPPSGAIAWWSLDETSGSMAYDRIGARNGTYVGSPEPAEGKVRGGLHFPGGSSYVAAPDSDLWAFGDGDFTIEFWANWDQPGSGDIGFPGDVFIGSDDGAGEVNKWFFALGGGFLHFTVYNVDSPPPNFFLAQTPFSPVVGEWYHLAISKEGTLFTISVNGAPVGSEISPSPIANASAPLTIGYAEGFTMHGRLDEMTLYNRALTQVELQAIFEAGSGGKCTGLGNALVPRQYPSDGVSDVFVVYSGEPVTEDGTITAVKTYKQSGAGLFRFNAYVLRPTANANEYDVVFDSGTLDLTDSPADSIVSFPLPPFNVKAGDLIAHYGAGIPADIPGESPDDTYWIPGTGTPQPSSGTAVVLGSSSYPFYQERTYSLAVSFTTTAAVDHPPVAASDSYSVDEDTLLNIAAPGVLANDSDVDADPLTAVLASGTSHGTLSLSADGSFTYTPNSNYSGSDSFSYRASDGIEQSATATVVISVDAVNDPPMAEDDSYNVNEDFTLTIPASGVLANDSDVDGDALSAILWSGPSHGTLWLNANGSFSYTPDPNYNGPDAFSYKASDAIAESALAAVHITVLPAPTDLYATWNVADGGNGNTYVLRHWPGAISWQDAESAAEAEGGHLATITTQEEQDFVVSHLIALDVADPTDALQPWGYWLGATKGSEDWQWVTGEPFEFVSWSSGSPSNPDAALAFLAAFGLGGATWFGNPDFIGQWDDVLPEHASFFHGFIVETELTPPPPDRDGDGVPDSQDGCPDELGLPQFNGCPDTDRDGVPDRLDVCPTIPGDAALNGCPASATRLTFHDLTLEEGDQISTAGDIISAQLDFDPATGAFTVTWLATPAHPFNGDLVLNLNLGNTRIGGELLHLANTFAGVDFQTKLSYSGTADGLTAWQLADEIVTSGGQPLFNTAFHSGLVDLDDISLDERDHLFSSAIIGAGVDTDGDGVPDIQDACPNIPGEPAYNGCPPPSPDRDGDGVPDSQDACPDLPGAVAYNGCPAPPTLTCPSATAVEGCGVSAIGPLAYSEATTSITAAQFEAEGGVVSSPCGIASISYTDISSGNCPIVVTRVFTVTDPCARSVSCQQVIEVRDSVAPQLTCPATQTFKGCQLSAISPLTYSESPISITLAQLQAAGGNASDGCGIGSITYQDVKAGSCPDLVVTRTFTVLDACGNIATCSQRISSAQAPVSLPDLTVLSATVDPDLTGGQGYFQSATVANLGQSPARSIQVRFELVRVGASTGSSGTVTVPGLDPGTTATVGVPKPFLIAALRVTLAGDYIYRVTIDVNDRIPEANESNNILEQRLSFH